MTTHLEFSDKGTNVFQRLANVSLGLAKDAMQIEASKIAKVYKREIRSTEPSEWGSFKDKDKGRRRLTVKQKKAKFGAKHSRRTGEPIKGNIADHVKYYAPKELDKLYIVIGGGHPTFYPIKWEDGVAVGYEKRVTATTQQTLEFLDGLNDGKTIEVTKTMRKFLNTTEGLYAGGIKKSTKRLHVKARHFAEKARARGMTNAITTIKNRFDKNFPKAIANIEVKEVRTKTA